jgi:hypothetical protein
VLSATTRIKSSFATGLWSLSMVNCSLSARRKTRTSLPRSNINYAETSIPRLPSQNHMHTNTGSPTELQTTIQKLISSVPADLVPVGDLSAPTRRIDVSLVHIYLKVLQFSPADSRQCSWSWGISSTPTASATRRN